METRKEKKQNGATVGEGVQGPISREKGVKNVLLQTLGVRTKHRPLHKNTTAKPIVQRRWAEKGGRPPLTWRGQRLRNASGCLQKTCKKVPKKWATLGNILKRARNAGGR